MQFQEQSNLIDYFKSSFQSNATATAYTTSLLRYCPDLAYLKQLSQKEAEDQLIQFIITNKEKGKTWAALHNYVAAVARFYLVVCDINLNLPKVKKFLPEHKRIVKDRAYTDVEILKLLELANERTRCVVLILASSGIRVGVLPELAVSNLEDRGDIYRITAYQDTDQEYITFTTPECKQAIKQYFAIRERHGETITKKSPVIREQYDKRNSSMIAHPRKTAKPSITYILNELLERAGMRPPISKQEHHEVARSHGFRKFFCTTLMNADLKTELRWLLEGHSLQGNDPHYIRVTADQLETEYRKAIDLLTIDPTKRLQRKVEMLTVEKSKVDELWSEMQAMKQKMGI